MNRSVLALLCTLFMMNSCRTTDSLSNILEDTSCSGDTVYYSLTPTDDIEVDDSFTQMLQPMNARNQDIEYKHPDGNSNIFMEMEVCLTNSSTGDLIATPKKIQLQIYINKVATKLETTEMLDEFILSEETKNLKIVMKEKVAGSAYTSRISIFGLPSNTQPNRVGVIWTDQKDNGPETLSYPIVPVGALNISNQSSIGDLCQGIGNTRISDASFTEGQARIVFCTSLGSGLTNKIHIVKVSINDSSTEIPSTYRSVEQNFELSDFGNQPILAGSHHNFCDGFIFDTQWGKYQFFDKIHMTEPCPQDQQNVLETGSYMRRHLNGEWKSWQSISKLFN